MSVSMKEGLSAKLCTLGCNSISKRRKNIKNFIHNRIYFNIFLFKINIDII